MRFVVVSLLLHVLGMMLVASDSDAPMTAWTPPQAAAPDRTPTVMDVVMLEEAAPRRVAANASASSRGRRGDAVPRSGAPRGEAVRVSIAGIDRGDATGTGTGNGVGTGIGFGDGGGIATSGAVPSPPPAPVIKVSKARPAKLVFPSRDREVEDEADLFVARVTVDQDGDVVGARMLKTKPGSRGEQAADAIWTFRYLPALDDDGHPLRSTLEQPFQIR